MKDTFDFDAYLVDAYQGEVLGEAFFALAAEREADGERAAKWRLVERLERHVKARLRPVLAARGLATDEDPARVEEGRKLATSLGPLAWPERMRAIAAGVQDYVARFRAADEAAGSDLAEITGFVLAHEEALHAFFEREAAGDGQKSTEPVVAFLETTHATDEPPLPEGLALMPFDPVYKEDPYAVLARLRERAPVHRDRETNRVVVTGHDDVMRVVRDLSLWSDPRKALPDDPVRFFLREGGEPSMLFLDDPDHRRLRKLVASAFTPRAVERSRPLVARVAKELVDAIEASGGPELDLMDALAEPLPAIAIARLLGVDTADQTSFKEWSLISTEVFFNPLAGDDDRARANEAQASLDAYFRKEIAVRRQTPADDLIGVMVRAEEEGDRLTEDEVVTMCNLLLIAGNVTTTDLIGNGVRALLEHPDQLRALQRAPDKIENAVEEMLRYDSPVMTTGRIVPQDVEIGGVPVRARESVVCSLAAANRDPAVYPDPDRFDIGREDTHHQSFGGGHHLCMGAHLARVEAQEAIGALVARFPKLRPSERGHAYKQVPGFRGFSEYWIRID